MRVRRLKSPFARLFPLLLLTLVPLLGLTGCPVRPAANRGSSSPPVLQSNQADAYAGVTPVFTDIAKQAGIAFKQSHGGCGLRYFPEQVAAGAAVFDAN